MFEFCSDRGRKVAAVARCAAAGLLLAIAAPAAQAYSSRVNAACEGDYYRLTREMVGRRVNLAVPDDSTLLEKSLGAVTHTGVAFGCFTPPRRG